MELLCALFLAIITRAADIRNVPPHAAAGTGIPFELEGEVIYPFPQTPGMRWNFHLRDASGTSLLHDYFPGPRPTVNRGDKVRADGHVVLECGGIFAHCEHVEVVGHSTPPAPVRTSVRELIGGQHADEYVTIVGEVVDVFVDEIDADYLYLAICEDGATIFLPVRRSVDTDSLLGTRVEATGYYLYGANVGKRQNIGHLFYLDAPLRIVSPRGKSLFDVGLLDDVRSLAPAELTTSGRRRVCGTVIAVWHGDRAMLQTDEGRLVRIDLVDSNVPATGSVIDAVGLPATDLYHVNLTRARWRPCRRRPAQPAEPISITIRQLFLNDEGRHRLDPEFHGRRVRICGIVRALPSSELSERRLLLEDDGFLLPVDVTGLSETDLAENCRVEASGVCIAEIPNWQPNAIFPTIGGFMIVPGPSDSFTVLSRPSWWTTGRLIAVIGALVAILLGATLWNVSLRTLAERRGRELNEETVARVSADLKVYERTRLAVELHDSLAQSLTGVSLEIKTAERLADADEAEMRRHLGVAGRVLESCRLELRNCLWDLRHHALEHRDMNAAIQQTLAPVLGTRHPSVAIRFAVPRERLTDNTAHAILRIIRELTANAIRHGGATEIRIAGAIERNPATGGGILLFSVTDNGCGFDPATALGVDDGHFGLEGVRERVSALNGSLALESSPGRSTRAVIKVNLPDITADA